MAMLPAAALLAALLPPADAAASAWRAERTLAEDGVRVDLLSESEGAAPQPAPAAPSIRGLLDLGTVVNLGARAWRLFVRNRAQTGESRRRASALPKGAAGPGELSGWRPARSREYLLTARNLYGAEVVRARWRIVYIWGGSAGGKGRYLAAVGAEPVDISPLYGFRLDLRAQVEEDAVVNAGTPEEPVAAMMPEISWRIRSRFSDRRGRALYWVRGDGVLLELGGTPGAAPAPGALRARFPPR